MPHAYVRVFRHAPPLQLGDLPELGEDPTTEDAVHHQISHANATTGWAVITGGEPLGHPDLCRLVSVIKRHGLRVKLTTGGLAPTDHLEELRDAGVDILVVVLTSLDSGPGLTLISKATTLSNLRCTARIPLTKGHAEGLGDLIVRALDAGAQEIEVRRADTRFIHPSQAADRSLVERALSHALAATTPRDVPLSTAGLASWPAWPTDHEPPLPVHRNLLNLLRDGAPLPGVGSGARISDVPERQLIEASVADPLLTNLGLELASRGVPIVDAPPCVGGADTTDRDGVFDVECADCPARQGCRGAPTTHTSLWRPIAPHPAWLPCPPGRVVVINPFVTDKTLCTSTLPGLAGALEGLGRQVEYVSAWGDPSWRDLEHVVRTQGPVHATRMKTAHEATEEMMKNRDYGGASMIIVPGFDRAAQVLAHPTLPSTCKVVIADFHLLHGIDTFKGQFSDPRGPNNWAWWPSENVTVHSCFPGYSHLYRFAGIPFRQIHWRPYPMNQRVFGLGPPPNQATEIFAGGNQRRDWTTLLRAAEILDPRQRAPIQLFTRFKRELPHELGITHRNTVPLKEFYRALASSRFVVMPVTYNRHQAAGLTVISMALAAGRPVIAAHTPGTADHLRHNVSGLLVPPGDTSHLADAIQSLQSDEKLLARLAEGARQAGDQLGALRWAQTLIHGAPPSSTFPHPTIPGFCPW